jgi:cell division transport system ATP-binding protein
VIEIEGLSKLYGHDVFALDDVSMRVEKGEFAFLTGPSGAGKSTLLRILLCQESPTGGRVVVGGRDITSMTRRQVQASSRTSSCCRRGTFSRT